MQITEKKSSMLYKNESGGRIMVRVSLPCTENKDSDFQRIYDSLSYEYFILAKKFVASLAGQDSYFLEISYEMSENEKYIKIKRITRLRKGTLTVKTKIMSDCFYKDTLIIKK